MSNFRFTCPFCDQVLDCDDSLENQLVKCPACGEEIVPERQSIPNIDTKENENYTSNIYSVLIEKKGFIRKKTATLTFDFNNGLIDVIGEDRDYYIAKKSNTFMDIFNRCSGKYYIYPKSEILKFSMGRFVKSFNLKLSSMSFYHNDKQILPEVFFDVFFAYKLHNNTFIELVGGKPGKTDCCRLFSDHITITHSGLLNVMSTMGIQGEKTVYIDKITSTQIKKPGIILAGYLQFSILGEMGRKDGITGAMGDENSIGLYSPFQYTIAQYVQNYINNKNQNKNQYSNDIKNVSSEIIKLKKLLDDGVITKADFDAFVKKMSK